jgi:GNAT superfamily N-acetyltransferase
LALNSDENTWRFFLSPISSAPFNGPDHNLIGCPKTWDHYMYAEGAFGTIPELYVRPAYRANRLGLDLVFQAKSFGASRGWTRLEVTTPPLPQFDRTLAFYEREGFSITGGRKLKVTL